MKEKFYRFISKDEFNEKVIKDIEKYVEKIIEDRIPEITFNGYRKYYECGSRMENEEIYFEKRKQLATLGLYLQWKHNKKAIDYFNELLWSISNEFTWALAAHVNYGKGSFDDDCRRIIDLFAAETAESLSELIVIHKDKINNMLINHIKSEIKERVINPFLEKKWFWETSKHNWNAVCGGCIGITALLLEEGEVQKKIINRVENALKYYIEGFGDDGASLEGIGYWTYGFGYYIYYKALKNELNDINTSKVKSIANFPQVIQISDKVYIPFSDVPPSMELPTGLISFLQQNYNINIPYISEFTSLDFDKCHRWAHLSRNLWWTNNHIFNKSLENTNIFLKDSSLGIYRRKDFFIAIKGGSNKEPHNHNDIGSFVVAYKGKLILTDLGAGAYTKDYFGDGRYLHDHTRSYYHSVPIINNMEQVVEDEVVEMEAIDYEKFHYKINMIKAYRIDYIKIFTREIELNKERKFVMTDYIESENRLNVNEGFISHIKPIIKDNGQVIYKINSKMSLILYYNEKNLIATYEKKEIVNHYNENEIIYRLSLNNKYNTNIFSEKFIFSIEEAK